MSKKNSDYFFTGVYMTQFHAGNVSIVLNTLLKQILTNHPLAIKYIGVIGYGAPKWCASCIQVTIGITSFNMYGVARRVFFASGFAILPGDACSNGLQVTASKMGIWYGDPVEEVWNNLRNIINYDWNVNILLVKSSKQHHRYQYNH